MTREKEGDLQGLASNMAELGLEPRPSNILQRPQTQAAPTYDAQRLREGKPHFGITEHWGPARRCSIPAHLAPGLVLLLRSSTELSPQGLAVTQLLPSLLVLVLAWGGERLFFKGTGTFPGRRKAGSCPCPCSFVTWNSCGPLQAQGSPKP